MDNGDDEVVEMDTFSVNSGYQVVGERRQSHNPHRGHSSVPATFSSSNDATVQALGMPTDFVEPTWSETFDAWRDLIMGCLGRSREGDEEIEELEGEYLPENQQEPIEPNKTGAGVLSSSINLIKATIGAGILALPYSISRMGYILGPCMLVFSGLVSVFTLTLVVKSCYVVIERWKERGIKVFPPLSFHSVMKEAVPSRIPIIAVDIILCLTLFGVLCSYLIIMGQIIPNLMQLIFPDSRAILYQSRLWISIAMIFVGPISFLKKLSALKFTSTAGLISICYIAGMVVYFFFNQDDITVTSSASPIEIRPVYISVETLSVFPIFVLAYVNHMNIFPIYSEFGKENPTKKTYQVIFIAMPFCMICFLVVATFGYLTWGFDTSANVINNYPTNNVAVVVARVCTTLIILASYPIVLNPARLNFDSALFSSRGPLFHPIARHCGETALLLLGSYTVAMATSNLDFVLSVIGCTGCTLLSYILPGFIFFLLTSPSRAPPTPPEEEPQPTTSTGSSMEPGGLVVFTDPPSPSPSSASSQTPRIDSDLQPLKSPEPYSTQRSTQPLASFPLRLSALAIGIAGVLLFLATFISTMLSQFT